LQVGVSKDVVLNDPFKTQRSELGDLARLDLDHADRVAELGHDGPFSAKASERGDVTAGPEASANVQGSEDAASRPA
jgi:hypothetical protein